MAAKSLDRRETGVAHPVDIHVGVRLRQRRTFLGMSQERLGAELGLTFQQVQKYERGANRIGASRLWELSTVLDVPVGFFFQGYEQEDSGSGELNEPQEPFEFDDPLHRKESVELIRAFHSIEDEDIQRRFYELGRALSEVS